MRNVALIMAALLLALAAAAVSVLLRPARAETSSMRAEVEAEGEYSAWLQTYTNVLNGTAAWNPDKAVETADRVADEALARAREKHNEIRKAHGVAPLP